MASPRGAGRGRPGGLPGRRGAVAVMVALAAIAIVLGLALGWASHSDRAASDPSFYRWTGRLPAQAGLLLRAQPTTQGMPAGSRAWRILYTTTGLNGQIAVASGLVIVPASGTGGGGGTSGGRPVVLWEHGTTGLTPTCAPSRLSDPLAAGGLVDGSALLAHGWALVAPDYLGLGVSPPHPYLVGLPAARSSLDAVRAARSLRAASLGTRTVVWGYSQGGGAALWTGIIADRYAPTVELSGVAAAAPASDLPAIIDRTGASAISTIFGALLLAGYAAAYPDVHPDDYLLPQARAGMHRLAGRCLADSDASTSLPAGVSVGHVFSRSLASGPLGAHLTANIPAAPTRIPTLIAQGTADTFVPATVQGPFAQRLCAAGAPLDYRLYPGLTHDSLVAASSPLAAVLMRWTAARFAGDAATSNCAA